MWKSQFKTMFISGTTNYGYLGLDILESQLINYFTGMLFTRSNQAPTSEVNRMHHIF